MIFLDLYTFFGHLHPMVVHLPIGFLLLAAGFNGLSYFKKYKYLRTAVGITLLAGFISAVIACVFGYLLSLSGDYDVETLSNHKYSGITLALLSGVLWFTWSHNTRPGFQTDRILAASSVVVVALLFYVGHQGGNLTHGSEYLSLETLTHVERTKPLTPEAAFVFEDIIAPVLEKRCVGCHRAGKRKGELLLTSWDNIMKGGKHGEVVVSGSLTKSELYQRITLDRDDEDFMPSDGKPPLTRSETIVIKWWIMHGAVRNKMLSEIAGYDSIQQVVSQVLALPGSMTTSEENSMADHTVNPLIPEKVDSAFINALRKNGFSIRLMSHRPVMLDLSLPSHSQIKMSDIEKELDAVSENIVWLNLSDNNFNDYDLKVLKKMTNLEKLRLEKNPIGDAIADEVKDLKYLNAINLNETKLTKKGMTVLRQNPSIKKIYCWKTEAEQSK
ncbi:MAG: DUF2231 domain-containing protein [Chryseolinea sp.]